MDKANKVKRPNIVRGGIAIPLGRNYYYMAGRKHKNGGIDIGKNPRTGLEVEDGEVMHIGKNEVKVFSSVPFLNGKSPAQKVMGGENPNKVFNQQEEFKDKHNMNDDGTKKGNTNKAKMGTIKRGTPIFNPFTKSWYRINNKGERIYLPNTAQYKKSFGYTMYSKDGFAVNYNSNGKEINRRKGTQTSSIIGKNRNEREQKYFDTDKEYTDSVKVIAKRYGLNPNVVASRLAREGVDKAIDRYNSSGGKHLISNDFHMDNISGPAWGLDDFYSNIKDGKAKLIEPWVGFRDEQFTNEKGRTTESAVFNKWSDIISATSAELKGRKDRLKMSYPNANDEQIDALSLGSFNMGETGIKNYIQKKGIQSAYDTFKPFIKLRDKDYNNKKRYGGINKAKAGGLYTLSVNGKQILKPYPSTGDIELSKRQKLTGTTVMRNGGRRKAYMGIDDDLVKKNDTTAPDYSNNTNPFTFTENTANPVLERNNEPISSTNVPRAFARRNRDITDPEKLSIAYQKESGTYPNWFKRTYRNVKDYINKHPETVIDEIGLGSNIIGGLISHKMNRDMLNKLKYNSEPIARKAAKLKTRININPQLDKMRETLAAYEKNVDSNTASSRVALARKQRARFANMLSTNELYGSKENIETELINKDKLNQQSVADANIRDYNDWSEKKAAFNNAILEKKGENDVSLINTINTGVQDVINRTEKRKSEKQTRLAFMAANPNVNPRILKIMGIKGITDKDIEAYDKAYGKKKKGKKSSDNN